MTVWPSWRKSLIVNFVFACVAGEMYSRIIGQQCGRIAVKFVYGDDGWDALEFTRGIKVSMRYFWHSTSVETVANRIERVEHFDVLFFWFFVSLTHAQFSCPSATNREAARRGVTKTSATSTKSNHRADIYFLLFRGNRAACSLFWI